MTSAKAQQKNFLVIGDSITKGMMQVQDELKYALHPDNFIQFLSDRFNLATLNWSVFGATIDKGLQILRRKAKRLPERPITLLEFGGNDCNFLWHEIARDPSLDHGPMTELADFKERYATLIRQVKAISEKVCLLNLPPLEPDNFFATVSRGVNADNILQFIGGRTNSIYRWQESYSQAVCELAQQESVRLIDIRTPFLAERNYEKFICPDGMHPNAAGHRLIAQALEQYFLNNPI